MKFKRSDLHKVIREAIYREVGRKVIKEGRVDELFGLFGKKKKKKGNVVTLDNPDKHTGQLQKAFNEIGGAMSAMGAKAIPQLFSNLAKGFAKGEGTAPHDENLLAKAMTEFNALKEKDPKRGFDGVEEMLLSLKNKQVGDQSVDKFMNAMLKLT